LETKETDHLSFFSTAHK